MKRRLTSRGGGWPGGATAVGGSNGGDEHTRLIAPHAHSGSQGTHRYMSTSDSEHDIVIEQVRLWIFLCFGFFSPLLLCLSFFSLFLSIHELSFIYLIFII